MFKEVLSEFKKFALKGNVLDMAVGVIIGASFGKIVDSLVKDVLMPPLGLLLGKVDFANLYITLSDGKVPGPYASLTAAQEAGAVTINYGMFINVLISFLIVAFSVFVLIKGINKLQDSVDRKAKKAEAAAAAEAPKQKACPYCKSMVDKAATRCPFCTSKIK